MTFLGLASGFLSHKILDSKKGKMQDSSRNDPLQRSRNFYKLENGYTNNNKLEMITMF
jgi:hypothetical protein